MFWNHETTPQEVGWYPVLVCYDIREGLLPSASIWDGNSWCTSRVVAFGEKAQTSLEAEELAYTFSEAF